MKKFLSEKQIGLRLLLIGSFVPYSLTILGTLFNYEIVARLFALMIYSLVFFVLIYFIFNSRYKKLFAWKNEMVVVGRIIAGFFAVWGLISLVYPFILDLKYITKNPISEKKGIITNVDDYAPFDLPLGSQFLTIDDIEYEILYRTRTYKPQQYIRIHYLPNSKYILKTEILDE